MSDEPPVASYLETSQWIATIRGMIEHENTLINQRMTWMWTLQGLLLAAASLLWTENAPLLPVIISVVGLMSCVSIGYSLMRGDRAIRRLLAAAKKYKWDHPAARRLPPHIGVRTKGLQFLMPNKCLSWVFGFMWVSILLLALCRAKTLSCCWGWMNP